MIDQQQYISSLMPMNLHLILYDVGGGSRKFDIFGKGEEDLLVLMLHDSTEPESMNLSKIIFSFVLE